MTPEKISKHLADRCCSDIIVDGFCGAGGNTIQFAFKCERGIKYDIFSMFNVLTWYENAFSFLFCKYVATNIWLWFE